MRWLHEEGTDCWEPEHYRELLFQLQVRQNGASEFEWSVEGVENPYAEGKASTLKSAQDDCVAAYAKLLRRDLVNVGEDFYEELRSGAEQSHFNGLTDAQFRAMLTEYTAYLDGKLAEGCSIRFETWRLASLLAAWAKARR